MPRGQYNSAYLLLNIRQFSRVIGDVFGRLDPSIEITHAVRLFQRVLGGDHPPYLIDFEAVESCTTDVQMTFVRRVEGAA